MRARQQVFYYDTVSYITMIDNQGRTQARETVQTTSVSGDRFIDNTTKQKRQNC